MTNILHIFRRTHPYPHRLWAKSHQDIPAPFFWRVGNNCPHTKQSQQRDIDNSMTILFALLGLIVFLILYQFRALDDNRLTSWQWVFADIGFVKVFLILAAAITLAYAFTKTSITEQRPVTFLFIFSFVAAMFLWSEPEVNVDASRYFVQAKHLELFGMGYFINEWGHQLGAWTDLPLIPLLYGLIFKFFGESRLGIQIFNTLLFSGTVVLTYLTGKILWNHSTGLYGGLLLLGMPYLLTQVPLMLVDVPTMFFLSLAIFITIKALRQSSKPMLATAAIAITLALLSKYSTWLMLSIVPIIALCHLNYYEWRIMARRATVIMLGSIFLVGLFILFKLDVVTEQFRLLLDFQLPGLERWGESPASTFLFQIHPFITLAALFSIYIAFTKKDIRYVIIAWLPLLVIVLGVNRIRYILVTLPMLALMAAYGISEISSDRVKMFFVTTVVASSLVIAIFGYLPFLQKTSVINIKEAGNYINSIEAERIEVIALPQIRSSINPAVSVPLLDLFSKKTLVFRHDSEHRPAPETIAKSPLRFSWQYSNPTYFVADTDAATEHIPVIIIFSDTLQALPERVNRKIDGYHLTREWTIADRVFRYKTIVRLYQPVKAASSHGINENILRGRING